MSTLSAKKFIAGITSSLFINAQAFAKDEHTLPSDWDTNCDTQIIQTRQGDIHFNPLPEVYCTAQNEITNLKIINGWDVNSENGELLYNPTNISVSLQSLALEWPIDKDTTITAGYLPPENIAAGGNLWFDIFPQSHLSVFATDQNFKTLAIENFVGATGKFNLEKTDKEDIFLRLTAGRRLDALTHVIGQSYTLYNSHGNQGESDNPSLFADLTHTKITPWGSIKSGIGGGKLSAGSDDDKDESRLNVYASTNYTISDSTKLFSTAELSKIWNENGQSNDKVVGTLYGEISKQLDEKTGIYSAAAAEFSNDGITPSAEGGITYAMSEQSKIFFSAGLKHRAEDNKTSIGTQVGFRHSFDFE